MPVYLPETENDIIKRNSRNGKLAHAMRKQQQHHHQQQQQLINSNTVGHFPRSSHYRPHPQHYRNSNQPITNGGGSNGGGGGVNGNATTNLSTFHISIPQLNLEVPSVHRHHQHQHQPQPQPQSLHHPIATLTAYSSTTPSPTNTMVSRHPSHHQHHYHHHHLPSSSTLPSNHVHNKAVSRITTTTTTTTTTVANHLMDNPTDKNNTSPLIAPDAYLQQSETQPAMLQMNEFDDDDITPPGIVVSPETSIHPMTINSNGNGNSNTMLLKPTIVNTTSTNNNNNDNNHVRRQPTSKTWISPFPSRRENLYFFMFTYKVLACPYRRNCPEKVICELYHHDGEKRRHPGVGPKFLYLEEACQQVKPIGSSKWLPATRCANGDQCQYSHTILEQMYHPNIYKTSMCMNYTNPAGNRCKWGYYCTHAHGQHDIRPPANRRSNTNANNNTNNAANVAQGATNTQSLVCTSDGDNEETTLPLVELRSPSAEDSLKRMSKSSLYPVVMDATVTATTSIRDTLKDNNNVDENGKGKESELITKQEEEEQQQKPKGEEEEGRKSMQIIGQSTTAVVEEFENVAYTKAMKQASDYFLWQEQSSRSTTIPSTAYEHYYFSNGPQCNTYHQHQHHTGSNHHPTMVVHPTHGMNGDEGFPFWKNEISPSPTTGLDIGVVGMNMNIDANVDMAMLWPERDNEPEFLGHLSRPAVQGGGIGLCDTDSDDEFVGTFPINIPLTPPPLAQQEGSIISGEDVLLTKKLNLIASSQKSHRIV